ALELPAIDTSATAGKRPNPAAPAPSAQWTSMQGITPCPKSVANLQPAAQQYPGIGQYLPVMTTTDCDKPDFLVQVFRNEGICTDGLCSASTLSADQRLPVAFSVGVRVYSALATKATVFEKEKASLTGTTGTGQAGTRPLAVLYTTVAKSDSSTSLNSYRALCRSGGTACE
ncbi:MAG: hypothetical protein LH631_11005, partial [Alkalinema sp. CAN_BIN05]|nr:hypothetical protein [Alkalinema sp. CAN_BIN05]